LGFDEMVKKWVCGDGFFLEGDGDGELRNGWERKPREVLKMGTDWVLMKWLRNEFVEMGFFLEGDGDGELRNGLGEEAKSSYREVSTEEKGERAGEKLKRGERRDRRKKERINKRMDKIF
jgi:hypothetical protein